MDRSGYEAASGYRMIKFAIGALAPIAALAVAIGMAMAASLFASLAALALSAGAGFAASLESLDSGHHLGWRLGAWAALATGWIVLAMTLANAPQHHVDSLLLLSSALLGGDAALRVCRGPVPWRRFTPGIGFALLFALIGLVAVWSALWMPAGAMPAEAVCLGCISELAGTGGFWIGEAFDTGLPRAATNERPGSHASTMTQMA